VEGETPVEPPRRYRVRLGRSLALQGIADGKRIMTLWIERLQEKRSCERQSLDSARDPELVERANSRR